MVTIPISVDISFGSECRNPTNPANGHPSGPSEGRRGGSNPLDLVIGWL